VPTHPRLLEALIEDHLATIFGNSTADRIALLLTLGVVHVRFTFLQVVQRRGEVLLGSLESATPFLLGRSGDDLLDAILVVTQRVALMFGPPVRRVRCTTEQRGGKLRNVFTGVKEIHTPTARQPPVR